MIQIFNSKKSGPNLVIMAGVHGDEPCGLEAFAEIIPTLSIVQGTVTFVLGNPKATAVHRREFEANLNRMFRADSALSEKEKTTYEYRRSRELMPILAKADALLDIHSSTTKDTVPFIICEPQSYDCAAILPANVVVSGIDALHPTGTDAYVNQAGGLGICIECGNHSANTAKEVAILAIKNFLKYFAVAYIKNPIQKPVLQTHLQADWIYKNKSVFTLSKKYQEFAFIKKGVLIGIDGREKIIAPYDGYILFPHNSRIPDTEVFVFGK